MKARSHISLVAVVQLFACGCDQPNEEPVPFETSPASPNHYVRSALEFELVDFFKPKSQELDDFDFYMSPLICQEVTDSPAVPVVDRFGAVTRNAAGHLEVDPAYPTVYYSRSTTVLHGQEYPQLAFLWCYAVEPSPAAKLRPRQPGFSKQPDFAALRAQGIRLTLDRRGFPAIIEVLTDSSGLRVIFVTKRLEKAAIQAFGEPLPKRHHAVERSLDEQPHVVVPRVLDEGPAAMGPYVYQTAGTRDVATLLCRCAPTRAKEFREVIEYDFMPLEALQVLGTESVAWPSFLPARSAVDAAEKLDLRAPAFLGKCLRLPAGF